MAKKQKMSKDEQEKAEMERMQKRVENLLPPKAEIPASINIQQAEELKARIVELEEKLSQKQADERANLYQASNINSQLPNQTTVSETSFAATEADDTFLKKIKSFFSPPVFPKDDDKTRRAFLLHVILNVQVYIVVLAIGSTIFDALTSGKSRVPELAVLAGSLLLINFWRFLMHRGNVSVASAGLIIAFTLGISSLIALNGTVQSVAVIYFPLSIIMAVLLISRRAGIIAFVAIMIIGIGITQLQVSGLLPTPNTSTNLVSIAVALDRKSVV
jgi:hypothetical protein